MTDGLVVRAVVQPRGPAAAVLLSDAQVAEIGQGAKTPPVLVTVNGEFTFAGRVGRMGGESLIGFTKAVRAAARVEAGDEVELVVRLDAGERTVEVPADLAEALEAASARPAFDALAYTHRKEHVRAVVEAKRAETRERRIAAIVTALVG